MKAGVWKASWKWGLCDPPRTKDGGKPWWGGVAYHRQWGGKPGYVLSLQWSRLEPGTPHCPLGSGSQSSGMSHWTHGPYAGTYPGGWPRLGCLPYGGLAAGLCSLTRDQSPMRPPLGQLLAPWSHETTQNLLRSPAEECGLQNSLPQCWRYLGHLEQERRVFSNQEQMRKPQKAIFLVKSTQYSLLILGNQLVKLI